MRSMKPLRLQVEQVHAVPARLDTDVEVLRTDTRWDVTGRKLLVASTKTTNRAQVLRLSGFPTYTGETS